MAETFLAIYDTADEAMAASKRLQREGFSRSAITLMSSEPIYEATREASQIKRSRLGGFAILGAAFGAVNALLLTILPSQRYPLNTGGMPIVAFWAFGIILFELAMLGAILATLGRMIYESRLARPNALACYDEAVADGKVALAVECADDEAQAKAKQALGERINRQEA